MTTEQMNLKVGIVGAGNDKVMVKDILARMESTEQMNKEVCQWLGICWHEPDHKEIEKAMYDCTTKLVPPTCSCGFRPQIGELYCPSMKHNPDFSQGAGIIRMLELLLHTEDGMRLVMGLIGQPISPGNVSKLACQGYCVIFLENYITTPGKLLQAVWEWSKEHPK